MKNSRFLILAIVAIGVLVGCNSRPQLNGYVSELTSADSLSIKMSNSLRTDLFLMPLSAPVDSVSSAVVMIETFLTDSIHGQSRVSYFTPEWKKWSGVPPLSDMQQKCIQISLLQNILKKDEEIVNKY